MAALGSQSWRCANECSVAFLWTDEEEMMFVFFF